MELNLKLGKENRIFIDGKTLNQIADESGVKLGTVQHRYTRAVGNVKRVSIRENGKLVTHHFRVLEILPDNI